MNSMICGEMLSKVLKTKICYINFYIGIFGCVRDSSFSSLLVPAMELREVSLLPGFTKSRLAQVPVGTSLPRNVPQVVPQVHDRRPSPEPVAVIDFVHHQP